MASTIVRSLHFFSETPKNPKNTKKKRHPPLKISTLRSDVDPAELRDLLASSDLSCHRFPALDPSGRPEPVDLDRLRLAISHSAVVVSVFCSPPPGDLGFRLARGRLAGFGRAVSDLGLTASIHDVVNTGMEINGHG
ncbi:hypothetical protein QJS10_CPA03g00031 [Acorus calamus]|uniref:Glucosamine-phosphate N-acetyltransferase n=1 Tax=Acorus calamus TaxID=4465 RepID=A0AAV9F578_ACOCL|nr:hypothetical protein QJS10_CPA03g00031 [Acorus calamus]